ncbi:MAG TPA: hypothetical protein VGQ96_02060, partial [Candidatus Eremiobacteraceae bacterium]|nr:hypothetical protein [Candidatus Eremiobacteraceae bacterium]
MSYQSFSDGRLTGTLRLSLSWLSFAAVASAQTESTQPVGKHFDRVVIVVLENQGTRQALADSNIAT